VSRAFCEASGKNCFTTFPRTTSLLDATVDAGCVGAAILDRAGAAVGAAVFAATLFGLGCSTGLDAGGDAIGGFGFATDAVASPSVDSFSGFGWTAALARG
jgi:succinyl-CoA synthetase alpha subunit